MTTSIANIASPASAPRDAVCVQALHMLRTTAQQWGMRLEWPGASAAVRAQPVVQTGKGASNCAGLHSWKVAA